MAHFSFMPGVILERIFAGPDRTGRLRERPVGLEDVMKFLRREKPSFLWVRTLDATTARDREVLDLQGDFLAAVMDASTVAFQVRLNEEDKEEINLKRILALRAPYYRLFISNKAGQGSVTLMGGKGVEVEPRLTSLEELAARLGAPTLYDRRGEVLWYDDFESSTLHWDTATTGIGAVAALVTDPVWRGGQAVQLTTGDAIGGHARIERHFAVPVFGRIGVSVMISVPDPDNTDQVNMRVSMVKNGTGHTFELEIRPSAGEVYYLAPSALVKIMDFDFYPHPRIFHAVKLVVDLDKGEYVRLLVDDEAIPMEGIQFSTAPSTVKPHMRLLIGITEPVAGNHTVYVDDVIITQNEP